MQLIPDRFRRSFFFPLMGSFFLLFALSKISSDNGHADPHRSQEPQVLEMTPSTLGQEEHFFVVDENNPIEWNLYSQFPSSLELEDTQGNIFLFFLPALFESYRIVYQSAQPQQISKIRIISQNQAEGATLRLIDERLLQEIPRLIISKDHIILEHPQEHPWALEFLYRNSNEEEALSYWPFTLSNQIQSRSWKGRLRRTYGKSHRITFIHPQNQAFSRFSIEESPQHLILEEVSWKKIQTLTQVPQAISVEPGILPRLGMSHWRQRDYELYYWADRPSVLILDTRTLAIQSRFFRRLAFFVEKSDSRGQLRSDEYLLRRKDWNAHDYRSEDIASFFQRVDEENFPLLDTEKELRSLLEKNNFIYYENERWHGSPHRVLLSFSQELALWTRHLLLEHELYHAIFFTEALYENFVRELWETLSEDEKKFWELFLRERNYDTSWELLKLNEFQAYLLQQEFKQTAVYFTQRLGPLLKRFPQNAALIRKIGENPDSFVQWAQSLAQFLEENFGYKQGRLYQAFWN